MKNKIIALIIIIASALTMTSCGKKSSDKLRIVTTLFPQYDFAKHIAGENGEVTLLLTPGAESHSYEPTASDIAKIQQADLFIYNGGESEVWVGNILDSYGVKGNTLRLMDHVSPLKEEDEDEYDEHIFTSLKNSLLLMDAITDKLCAIDEKNSDTYKKNASGYKNALSQLDSEFEKTVASAPRRSVVIGDRNPFRYIAEDYGLDIHAAFSGCSSESEASPATMSALISEIQNNNVPTIFHIEFSSQSTADKLSDATGAKTALLHSCHNISREDMDKGVTYLDLQKQNLANLSEALSSSYTADTSGLYTEEKNTAASDTSENMFERLSSMMTPEFIKYILFPALIGGAAVTLCSALLGVSLVLKKYSMIGDGLSHVGYGALAVASVMNMAPLRFALPVVIAAAVILLRLSDSNKLRGDSAIAVFSTTALAIGILVSSKAGMMNDVSHYLFGSILAMNTNDVILSVILSALVIIIFILFYNKIFAVTFDESFSKATGIKINIYKMLIAVLTAVTIVLGMMMMGSLLISSLIIFPALTSMRVCRSFRSVVVCSAIISLVSFLIGLMCSLAADTAPGATVVVVNVLIFLCFTGYSKIRER